MKPKPIAEQFPVEYAHMRDRHHFAKAIETSEHLINLMIFAEEHGCKVCAQLLDEFLTRNAVHP